LTSRKKRKIFKEAQKWILDLFFKLEPKIDYNKKKYKILKKLDEFVNDGTILSFLDWRNCLKALNERLDELGVTKIELPLKKRMKHPLLRGDRYVFQ